MTSYGATAVQRALASQAKRQDETPRFDPWKLVLWRNARGLTRRTLNEVAGYEIGSAIVISRIETYRRNVGPIVLERLAKALGVTAADLCSTGPEWRANKVENEAWNAAGRPSLPEWVAGRKA